MSEEGETAVRFAGNPGDSHAMQDPVLPPPVDNGIGRIDNPDLVPRAELDRVESELADLKITFDLRWDADQRAIKAWQAAHPGNELVWPDHADMVVWLMGELTATREHLEAARGQVDTLNRALERKAKAHDFTRKMWTFEKRKHAVTREQRDSLEACLIHLKDKEWFKNGKVTGSVACSLDATAVRETLAAVKGGAE